MRKFEPFVLGADGRMSKNRVLVSKGYLRLVVTLDSSYAMHANYASPTLGKPTKQKLRIVEGYAMTTDGCS